MSGSDSPYHPVVSRIRALLDEAGCPYKTFTHEPVRTSEEAAAIRPDYTISQGAKALIVRIKRKGVPAADEKTFVQIVLPGDVKFDPKKARRALNAKDIRFATEEEVAAVTDGVQPGGVPPFGNLFGLTVYVDRAITSLDEIVFNAGDRRFSIAMRARDYVKLVSPNVIDIV